MFPKGICLSRIVEIILKLGEGCVRGLIFYSVHFVNISVKFFHNKELCFFRSYLTWFLFKA